MYKNKSISLVIPAYNEAKLIKATLESVPEVIDGIYVVDDCSPDNQNEVISITFDAWGNRIQENPKKTHRMDAAGNHDT